MHSLEMLIRLNSATETRKLARANHLFNNPEHAKTGEKTGRQPLTVASWTSDAQWEAKMKREGKR